MGEESPQRDTAKRRDSDAESPGAGTSAFMVLTLHLFTFLCCANWIFGPLGIVFAARSAMNRERGRYYQAETLARYSWYCLGAGLVMLVVMLILVAVLAALGLPFAERFTNTPY